MKLVLQQQINTDTYVYNIIKNEVNIGSIELIDQPNINTLYIENIYKDKNYTGKRLLKEVLLYLRSKYNCNIACLPLDKYRSYYESLGFVKSLVLGEDIYYTLDINTQIP